MSKKRPARSRGFRVPWHVFHASACERSVIEALAKENPAHISYEVEEVWEDDTLGQTAKIRVEATTLDWLEHVWFEVQKAFWSVQMLASALRLSVAMHPDSESENRPSTLPHKPADLQP